jgi:hypothetical protein
MVWGNVRGPTFVLNWPTTYALFSFASELRVRNPDPAS